MQALHENLEQMNKSPYYPLADFLEVNMHATERAIAI